MKLIKLVILLFCVFYSCNKDSRENFSFERMPNNSGKIKLDGFYFYQSADNQYVTLFLYENGIMFDGSIRTIENDIITYMKEYDFSTQFDLPYYWGIYKIKGDTIIIEEWSSGTAGEYPVVKHNGIIKNDTTINFEDDFFGLMHFQKFSPKPDSTTEFID